MSTAGGKNVDNNLSRGELKIKLFETLKKQGVVDNIKAQLRNKLVEDLKRKGESWHRAHTRGHRPLALRTILLLLY